MANQVRISQDLLQQINSLTDQSTTDHWTRILIAFGQSLQNHGNVLHIINRPVCYGSPTQRTTLFNQCHLTQAARQLDTAHTYTAQAFGQLFRAHGMAGLIASPTASATFEGTPAAFNVFRQSATA